ncbi:hypothetical protein I553_5181 [Mycobacterium xenopi 4042]|uniref:Uncharacterized protein n=1 Tax=Mycobacterium xenopi 4042 TaxID=1299334 RepID=X7ZX14_MYCXE|nr:hypothetical protein I553_5181 [Mycobacterium xenopi 4042]
MVSTLHCNVIQIHCPARMGSEVTELSTTQALEGLLGPDSYRRRYGQVDMGLPRYST